MEIIVAGNKKEVADGLKLTSDKVAETVLKDGDNVEFLYFMGGGSYGINR